ncbi:MAG: hypothetical protein H7A23_04065 [Leptospiraceae bacterium]|nr:hypothetical protein [Leptospiraceae bacterium]MCP5493707.1 hypothetical protein [Leptospiraceae bacterium]
MKYFISAESAIDNFIKCKKEGKEVSKEVIESIKNYKKWREPSLIGLLNASAYYPEILLEKDMEAEITKLLEKFQKSIVKK